jgi:hypothetical protein
VSHYALLVASTLKRGSDREPDHFFLYGHFFFNFSVPSTSELALTSCLQQSCPLAMTASHPHLFQSSMLDENEIRKLVANHSLPDRAVLQWRPTAGEDILTPNTNEIVVFASFFQHGFSLLDYDYL